MATAKGETLATNGNGGTRVPVKAEPKPVSFTKLVVASFQQSQLTRMAAALAYRTMFALVPVLDA